MPLAAHRRLPAQSPELKEPPRFCHENEQARLFFRVPAFPSARSRRHAARVSQLDPAVAHDVGDSLQRRTSWLDIDRISAASHALSPRADSLADTRAPSPFPARADWHTCLGKPFARLDRGCNPVLGSTRIWTGDRGNGGSRHRPPVVRLRTLHHSSLEAAPWFLSLLGATAPCAPSSSIQ